jgi:hypothetical protein
LGFVEAWTDGVAKRTIGRVRSIFGAITVLLALVVAKAEPPVVPVGLDAYRLWDRWPQQRLGVRAYMRSTYDRRGGNESADASHFLYQLADDFNVTLDVEGSGVLYFARYNHWHGSPWHYVVDGVDHLVQETSSARPNQPVAPSVFLPERPFPNPLTWTWSATKGSDLMWVPIPFEHSFRMGYSRTRYGTGYYIWHQYAGGTRLSQLIRTWDGQTPPTEDVLDLLRRSGTDPLPAVDSSEAKAIELSEFSGRFDLPRQQTVTLAHWQNGPSTIRALEFSVSKEQALAFGRSRLRMTWDGRAEASVEAPVSLFFGTGTLYNRDGREYLVKAFPMHVRFATNRVSMACYFPMPYFQSAHLELVGADSSSVTNVLWRVRQQPLRTPANHVGYFHATYHDHPHPEPGRDLILLDTRQAEGGEEWSGSFIGTSLIFSERAVLTTLEGDPRFFFDDSQTPQAYGTGTEEWSGGGDYWGGENMTLPLAGHPTGARNPQEAKCDEDKIESAYRFLLADLMPFGRNAVLRLEHGGLNDSTEHYQTLVYWYGLPAPSLVQTDQLKIGDPASEQAHSYSSPQASAPYEITSRYEWGVDHLQGREIYPAETDVGRKTTSRSEFTLRVRPDNYGVLLRRKLDYILPNQRAEVSVADASSGNDIPESAWRRAGVWYLAGSNTCVYSDPKEELGATQHQVQTSNRRFRDDEFLLGRSLTADRQAIRVRVQSIPVRIPLYPEYPIGEVAWSELRYDAYCWIEPSFGGRP